MENKKHEFDDARQSDDLGQFDAKTLSEDSMEEENVEETQTKSGFFGKKTSNKEGKLKEEIEKLQTEKNELNDRFLRLYSEFDNYKKRTQKERFELIDTASERVILDILPVMDDFERAIAANEKIEDISSVKEGFELIYHKLLQILRKNGVEEVPAKGEPFDTDFHEAITHVPAPTEEEKGRVVDVIQKGYKMGDKMIRYAKVIVAN